MRNAYPSAAPLREGARGRRRGERECDAIRKERNSNLPSFFFPFFFPIFAAIFSLLPAFERDPNIRNYEKRTTHMRAQIYQRSKDASLAQVPRGTFAARVRRLRMHRGEMDKGATGVRASFSSKIHVTLRGTSRRVRGCCRIFSNIARRESLSEG